ncbi:MAG: urease accessory protein UreF [Rhodospirillales bacterium]|nr:urease accessory protein UreF [Rhodospirillales bacterium]
MAIDSALDQSGFFRLMAWLSPAFPVGAFAYSHGIECAVEQGLVRDRSSLTHWVAAIVGHGAGVVDAVLFREAWAAARANDMNALARIAELGAAMRGSAETALESRDQGSAFLATVAEAWPDPRLTAWSECLRSEERTPGYAVAVGAVAGWNGLPLDVSLFAFLQALAANLVSAGVRLIPLGQTDGQRTISALEEPIKAAVDAGLVRPLDDIGTATPMVELTSIRHETQYTRLFRS